MIAAKPYLLCLLLYRQRTNTRLVHLRMAMSNSMYGIRTKMCSSYCGSHSQPKRCGRKNSLLAVHLSPIPGLFQHSSKLKLHQWGTVLMQQQNELPAACL